MPVNDPVVAEQTPAEDHTIDQCWDRYTEEEHQVWTTLYERQMKVLKGRAAPEHFKGLELLNLNDGGIPNFDRINEKLYKLTGWQVVAVHGLIPNDVFFDHLANRRFVAGRFIRDADKLDYLPEPDIFHDVFGHVPLLTLPTFADYMQAYGEGGYKAIKHDTIENLTRLYWYTVEFGLINTPEGRRIYGAGIVSSQSESRFCLEGRSPNRIHFDLERIMRTDYRYDDFQQTYFVIDSYEELMESTANVDFTPIYERIKNLPDIPAHKVLPTDKVYHEGTQEYARAGGLAKQVEWV
ncbi:phenylalanine 4-monooxygenase [Marinicauda algicola]|uniref:Phenylalanine-4-hydroxylase n=1 Tax=Marinicauda algicola TaxID=2029849 RepID=A0A4S2H2E3_9PROT|nr:phenylalanine 4-monooxygenase [Marinicauda algicola]TGY89643.1 phenylalanine 4-monooxygenase [Marinicauda algicola]